MTKKILIVTLVVSVLAMTGCNWEAFGAGMAAGYYGASYQPSYYQPQHHPHGYYPSDYEHYVNDLYGIDDAYHHQQQHHGHHY